MCIDLIEFLYFLKLGLLLRAQSYRWHELNPMLLRFRRSYTLNIFVLG